MKGQYYFKKIIKWGPYNLRRPVRLGLPLLLASSQISRQCLAQDQSNYNRVIFRGGLQTPRNLGNQKREQKELLLLLSPPGIKILLKTQQGFRNSDMLCRIVTYKQVFFFSSWLAIDPCQIFVLNFLHEPTYSIQNIGSLFKIDTIIEKETGFQSIFVSVFKWQRK